MERFDGQREDEEVLFVFRRHIIAMRRGFYGLLIPFALGSIPYILMPDSLATLVGVRRVCARAVAVFTTGSAGFTVSLSSLTNGFSKHRKAVSLVSQSST